MNMTSSGGILGLFLLLFMILFGSLSQVALVAEMLIILFGSFVEARFSFKRVEEREPDKTSKKPGKYFPFLCYLPMFCYLVFTFLLLYF